MSVIPRRIIRQDLDLVRVFVEDVENEYIVVQDLPDTFSQGRNAFKVFGSDFLKQGVNLKFEILDSQGNPVFISPIKYRFNNGFPTLPYVYVGVEVYRPPINFGGDAELVILGELDENKVPFNIPDEFVGTYNVRFSKRINLDVSKIINDAPILFYRKPSIIAQEVVKKRLDSSTITTSTVERTISGSGISGFSNRNTLPQEYFPNPANTTQTDTGSAQTGTSDTNTQEYIADIKDGPGGDVTETLNRIEFKTGKVKTPTVFRRRSGIALFASEQPPTMVIRATGSGTFTSDMVGAKIKIPKESMTVFAPKQFVGDGNVGIGTGFGSFPSNLALAGGDSNLENAAVFVDDYTGSIERVVNEKEIHTKEPFYFRYGSGNDTRFFLADFGNHPYAPQNITGAPRANFTMSFTDTITDTTSSFAFDSFVDLTIKNARTFSGDVYKIRISGGSQTQVSDFPVLLETVLESPELLVDTLSPSGVLRSGYFQSQAHINKYFNTTGSNTTATSDSTTFIDGMKLSGSYSEHKTNASFGLDTPYAFRVDKDVVYELSMRVFGKKGPKKQADGTTKQEAKIFFHLSGSNLAGETKAKYNGAGDFGTTITDQDGNKVGLSIGDDDPSEVNYEKVSHAFTVPFKLDRLANTDTRFFIRVESGEWIIQDLSLKPALDTGFSPDQFKVRVPIPPNSQRPDRFEFIVNYYNPDGVEAEEITSIRDVDVQGQALLIQADDNLVKGTVTIGNVQGEGIEIKGGNSAFIRSVPFKGFISASQHQVGGFFIWSGSVSPGGVDADSYTGAGLEIHDGNTGDDESFFKFRTVDPNNNFGSTFDVKTSRFFLGQSTTQFVSGSLGNLEISSSNFHLTAQGDVTMSGTITAEAGNIGDFAIIDGKISGSNITMDANNSTIFKTDQGPGSDSSALFPESRNEFYIDFSPTVENPDNFFVKFGPNFMVDKDGILIASGATFQGSITASTGMIGGFQIGSSSLFTGAGATPNFFISGSANGSGMDKTNLFISSSGFQVNAQGAISASSGRIGGFQINDSSISSNNLLLEDSGEIRTSNFATKLSGFRISALGNGTAEFENIRVRGTLATTTFEKETVNAVGGRLYVANSTVISGSVESTDTSIKVQNASGFEVDEIIFAKKITGTGFSKEFMKITSISRQDASDDTDFTGFLHVERGFGGPDTGSAITDSGTDLNGSITKTQTSLVVDGNDARELDKRMIQIDSELMVVSGSPSATILQVHRGVDGTAKATHANNADIKVLDKDSAFLFGLVSPKQSYTDGQVLVSTGRYISGTGTNTVGSGFIELNANPTTGQTPFIEMVERTGSGIYDMERRLVLGDLSGFVGSSIGNRVSLPNNPGFGLASENVFLSGLIQASSGSIGGIKMESNKIFTGNGNFSGSSTGFFADSSGRFSLKNKISYDDTTSNLVLKPDTLDLDATNIEVSSTHASMSLGEGKIKLVGASTSTITVGASNSIKLSDDGTDRFLVVGSKSSFSQFDQSTAGIIFGTDNGTTKFEVVGNSSNYLSFNGASFDLKSQTFDLNTTNLRIENSTPSIRVGPASGGSRITLDGSSSELTFNSGSGETEVIKIDEKDSFTYRNNSTAAFETITGPSIAFTNGGVIRASGTPVVAPNQHIFGFTGEQAFFQGGRNGAVVDIRNAFSSGIPRGLHSTVAASGTATTATGLTSAVASGVNNASVVGVLGSADLDTTTPNSVKAVSATVRLGETGATSQNIFGVHAEISRDGTSGEGGLPQTFTASGSAVQGVGGQYAIHGKSAGTYQGFFEGIVAATNDVIAFQSSDKRLKTNIQKIDKPLEKILKLNGMSFEWKRNIDEKVENKTNIGIIAQEVEKVLPEIVKKRDDGYLAVKYEQLVPVLIEGIKEQQKQIDELKKKLEES